MTWDVNLWAMLVATIVYFGLGALWYGVLGKQWMAALGVTSTDLGGGADPRLFAAAFVLEAVAVLTLALLLANSTFSGAAGGMTLGALVGIGIWVTLLSVTFLYERRRPALFAIDGGYHVVALILSGLILGLWR